MLYVKYLLKCCQKNQDVSDSHVVRSVKGLNVAYLQMPVKRREDVAANLVVYLKQSLQQINQPGMSPFSFIFAICFEKQCCYMHESK